MCTQRPIWGKSRVLQSIGRHTFRVKLLSDIFENMSKTRAQLHPSPPFMAIGEILRIDFDFFLNGEQNISTKKNRRYPEAVEAKLGGSEGMPLRMFF